MSSSPTPIFETERLIVRTASEADADMFYALWTTPEVMRNVGFPNGLRITLNEIQRNIAKQSETEFGKYLVITLKATDQAIGECKLAYPNQENIAEPDIKLLPAFWGHKYGVEVWHTLVRYQFTHTNCDIVQTTPNVRNIASIKMQESLGGVCVGEDTYHFPEEMHDYTTPVHHYIYQVYRADWERSHRT